jgi:penicillin-binding protein 1A
MNKYNFLSKDSLLLLVKQPLQLKEGKMKDGSDGDSYLRAAVDKYLEKWCEEKYFHAEVDRSKKPFTTVMPPPNITGKLHMGHIS